MTYQLIDLTWVQLSRLLLLFRRAEAVEIADGREGWAILIHGRGYTRLLQGDVFPHGPGAFGPGYPNEGRAPSPTARRQRTSCAMSACCRALPAGP